MILRCLKNLAAIARLVGKQNILSNKEMKISSIFVVGILVLDTSKVFSISMPTLQGSDSPCTLS